MSEVTQPGDNTNTGAISVDLGGTELLPELQPLWEALFDHRSAGGQSGLPVQQREDTWELRLAHYHRIFERQPAFVLLARQGERPVGYALAYADDPIEEVSDGPVVTIETLIVLAEMRGQGLGGWLLEEAEAEGIDQWGAEVSAIEVPSGDASAEAFYARAGFVERGETWLRPVAAAGESVGDERDIDDDRLGDLLEEGSEEFAIGLEEGPDDTWLTSVVLVGCQPEPGSPADGAALEAALAPFAEAGARSALVALDGSNDPAWADELSKLGFKKVLRLVTRSIAIEQ